MFQRSISYTALLAGLFGASAAVADLTADRVWAQTIDLIEEAGGSITALATRDGDNLNISNVRLRLIFLIPTTRLSCRWTVGPVGKGRQSSC